LHEELKTLIIFSTQLQRIAIALALITHTIRVLSINRISITHRLSTIQQAAQIIGLEKDKPKPADSGTWDELKGHGYLAQMVTSH